MLVHVGAVLMNTHEKRILLEPLDVRYNADHDNGDDQMLSLVPAAQ